MTAPITATVSRFALDLRAPLRTARGTVDRREGFVLRIERGDVVGLGEATPLPGWTESLADCERALDRVIRALEREGFAAALAAASDEPAARHAASLARLDLEARDAGVPLARRLSGDASESVPANATVGDGDPRRTAARVRDAADSGFDCVKLKVGGRNVAGDAERLRSARGAAGSDVELRADANGAWDRGAAREAFEALADADVSYVEQPLPAEDLAGHAALRGGPVGIALDESLAAVDVADALAADAADALVLKPMALGGIDRARDVAVAAREAGVDPVVTTTVDGAVARAGATHLAAALAPLPACGLATADRLAADLAPDPVPVVGGRVRVPDAPGLGVDPGGVSV